MNVKGTAKHQYLCFSNGWKKKIGEVLTETSKDGKTTLQMPNWLSVCYCRSGLKWPPRRFSVLKSTRESLSQLCMQIFGIELYMKYKDSSVQILFEEICKEIRQRHSRLSLLYILNQMIPDKSRKGEVKMSEVVTFGQFRAYLRAVFKFLFLGKVLGQANLLTVVDALSKGIYYLCRREVVSFKKIYLPCLRISKVIWLRSVQNLSDKSALFQRVVAWLSWFAAAVVRATFYVTEDSTTNHLIFYRKSVWRRIEKLHFEKLAKLREFEEVHGNVEKEKSFCSRIRFTPKGESTRAIIAPLLDVKVDRRKERTLMRKVNGTLDMICKQQRLQKKLSLKGAGFFGACDNFYLRLRPFRKRTRGNEIFVVKTDLSKCFDRINLKKLRSILENLVNPESVFKFRLDFRRRKKQDFSMVEGTRKRKRHRKNTIFNRITVSEMARREIARYNAASLRRMDSEVVNISWGEAVKIINDAVINRKIIFKNKTYIAHRGIPQGTAVSTRLCDIYLGSMERSLYPHLLSSRNTLLLRYVDDYLLLTTDKSIAENFLLELFEGEDNEYDVKAEASKTEINFESEVLWRYNQILKIIKPDEPVAWCGYEIYPQTMKISIDTRKLEKFKSYQPVVEEVRGSVNKRKAIMRFTRAALKKKYFVLSRAENDKWKVNSMKRLAYYGFCRYLRPLVKKLGLNLKDNRNRLFVRRFQTWIKQNFSYRYNRRMAKIFLE